MAIYVNVLDILRSEQHRAWKVMAVNFLIRKQMVATAKQHVHIAIDYLSIVAAPE